MLEEFRQKIQFAKEAMEINRNSMNDPSEERQYEFNEYLYNQPHKHLAFLTSLMYLGREGQYDESTQNEPLAALGFIYDRSLDQEKYALITSIIEKRNILNEYLEKGFELIKSEFKSLSQ